MIQMPSLKQVPSHNYSPTPIAHDLVIVHRCEGGYAGSIAWLCDRRANASAHLVMRADGSEVTQLVPLQYKAWAQVAFNSKGVSLEIEGFTAQGMSDETMRGAAKIVAWLCRAYGIPCQHAAGGQGRGVTQHHDLGAAGGNHTDCFGVNDANWQKFMGFVTEAYDAFSGARLPTFALHGAPGPHEIELPPDVALEASHGGASRRDDDDPIPPPSPADGRLPGPVGSILWLQAALNRAGASPALVVDGDLGDRTKVALAKFQTAKGLSTTSGLTLQTIEALEKVGP